MSKVTEQTRTLEEELTYRTGFAEGARTVLAWIPKYLDRGLPWVDTIQILDRWTQRLEDWARTAVVDGNGDSAPPKP